jgi:uncharacterized membrane protein YuzA (DUF378 family)
MAGRQLSILDRVALVLLIIGGINWGLVGALQFNIVSALFGPSSLPSRLIYVLMGVSAFYVIYLLGRGFGRS